LNDSVAALAIDDISLVAHSQGCLTALEFAARYPDHLKSVSFIASGLATPVNPALIDAAENNPGEAIAMMTSWGFGSAGHKHQGAIPGHSMLAGGRNVMRRNVPGPLAADLRACDAYANGKVAAAKITVPTQVILGDKDRMAPRKATQQLVDHLAKPEVHIVENCGHMVPLESPDRTRALLREFIFTNNPAS
jgi:pimeloyl-ACP methyl ester carboxylesterase